MDYASSCVSIARLHRFYFDAFTHVLVFVAALERSWQGLRPQGVCRRVRVTTPKWPLGAS